MPGNAGDPMVKVVNAGQRHDGLEYIYIKRVSVAGLMDFRVPEDCILVP
jgi:hypothetical protein